MRCSRETTVRRVSSSILSLSGSIPMPGRGTGCATMSNHRASLLRHPRPSKCPLGPLTNELLEDESFSLDAAGAQTLRSAICCHRGNDPSAEPEVLAHVVLREVDMTSSTSTTPTPRLSFWLTCVSLAAIALYFPWNEHQAHIRGAGALPALPSVPGSSISSRIAAIATTPVKVRIESTPRIVPNTREHDDGEGAGSPH